MGPARLRLQTNLTLKAIAKTNSRRLVPITPNLKAWLALAGDHRAHGRYAEFHKTDAPPKKGPVLELANVVNALKRLMTATRPPATTVQGAS